MFKGDRNFAVGLFVSIAIAAFVAFVIWLTGRSGAEEMTRYTMRFDRDVSGLSVGGPVKFMGMNIGTVIHMELDRSDGVRVQVDVEILASTPVDKGTYASLALQGITGVAVVNLASEPGTHAPLDKPPRHHYPEIPVKDVGFAAVLSSAPEIMNKLDRLLARAGEMLGEDNRDRVGHTLQNIETLTATLADDESLAALPGNLSATLAETRAALGELQDTVAGLRPDLSLTLQNLNRSSEHLAQLTERLDAFLLEHEDNMDRFMQDALGEAPALMTETRRTLRSLEKLLAEMRADPSQLIHRPEGEAVEIEP